MKSTAQFNFARIPEITVPRSVFDRSHGHKTAFNVSDLIPIFVDEVVPGDTFSLRATIFARLMTLISPIMDNLWFQTFFFWCPMRILWDHTRDFFGEQRTYLSVQPEYSIPRIVFPAPNGSPNGVEEDTLGDYFGLPLGFYTEVGGDEGYVHISALPFRAYYKIWNRWFRDENLQELLDCNEDSDGPDYSEDYEIQKVCKFSDYFTRCLPWPQKGDAVLMPIGESAPVIGNGTTIGLVDGDTDYVGMNLGNFDAYGHNLRASTVTYGQPAGTTANTAGSDIGTFQSVGLTTEAANSGMIADLSAMVGAYVNDMRLAFQLQKYREKDARGGTRFGEQIKAHYGVDFVDTIYEPEYLGGSKQRISINPVQKTYEDTGTEQVGDLRATGTMSDSFHGFTKSFTEPGFIIGLACIRGDVTYCQSINKMWQRELKEDYYFPEFAHLGEQAVLQSEIFAEPGSSPFTVFGYQERFAEMRYKPSLVTGAMRPTHSLSLSSWNLCEEFDSAPELNDEFIVDNTPIVRCLSVTDQAQCKVDIWFDLKCARPMPLYSVPGLIDHF